MAKRARHEADGGPERPAGKAARPGPVYHRLGGELASYLAEVKGQLEVAGPEEGGLLASRVFEEVAGKEVAVASEATGSHALEAAMPLADLQALLGFAEIAFSEGVLPELSGSAFGSHVAERMLEELDKRAAAGQAAEPGIEKALAKASATVCARLYEFVTDRSGSHVARRLLCVLAGRNVLPAASAGRAKDGASYAKATKDPFAGLAGKLGGTMRSDKPYPPSPARHALLTGFADALLGESWDAAALQELVFHTYGSPWLQALLNALEGSSSVLEQLVPRLLGCHAISDGAGVDTSNSSMGLEVDADHVRGLMQERISSHVMEVVFRIAPSTLRRELWASVFHGALPALAGHPAANFVVQAALAAATSPDEVKGALRALREALPGLLHGRRGGVVAALVAAAARTGVGHTEAISAVVSALAALASRDMNSKSQSRSGDLPPGPMMMLLRAYLGSLRMSEEMLVLRALTRKQYLPELLQCCLCFLYDGAAEALMTLDMPGGLDSTTASLRLSPVGCAILTALLQLPEAATSIFATSLALLSGSQLAAVGKDAGGSRALEAYFASQAPAKAKRRALRQLAGSWAALGASPGGSYVVQAAYVCSALKEQESIAKELAAAEESIASTRRGLTLLSRLGIADYKRDADMWRRRKTTMATLRGEYETLLGAGLAKEPMPEESHFPPGNAGAVEGAGRLPFQPSMGKLQGVKKRKKGPSTEDVGMADLPSSQLQPLPMKTQRGAVFKGQVVDQQGTKSAIQLKAHQKKMQASLQGSQPKKKKKQVE